MPESSYDEILQVLDQGARDFTFPMLDNGYVYLAASRLSIFSSATDWAVVFEIFGFSPRAGIPDLQVAAFTSRPVHQEAATDFVSEEGYGDFLRHNANLSQASIYPIGDGDWIDPEDGERVSDTARTIVLRENAIPMPSPGDYKAADIVLAEPPWPLVFELSRALAYSRREAVLATDDERRSGLQSDLKQVLLLDDWHHPNVVDEEARPSGTETFRQLAMVAATGDPGHYRTEERPNNHWSNWPDGGTL